MTDVDTLTDTVTAAGPVIVARGVRHRYRGESVDTLAGIDLAIPPGTVTGLVGVNGCGKSTLLRALSGTLRPTAGSIEVAGIDPARTGRRAFARQVSVVHQSLPPVPGLRVGELVSQGRYAVEGSFGLVAGHGAARDARVEEALAAVGLADRSGRLLDSLSGGERQRARLATALVQGGRVLLLDEPTAHLDIRHQLELLDLVRRVARERGLTVVVVLHDLDHAARFCDRLVVLHQGRVQAAGSPAEVITEALLRTVFGVAGRIVRDASGRIAHIVVDAPLR